MVQESKVKNCAHLSGKKKQNNAISAMSNLVPIYGGGLKSSVQLISQNLSKQFNLESILGWAENFSTLPHTVAKFYFSRDFFVLRSEIIWLRDGI